MAGPEVFASSRFLRLPSTEGVTAVTVDAPSIAQAPISFYARAAGSSLANFPRLAQAGDTAQFRADKLLISPRITDALGIQR